MVDEDQPSAEHQHGERRPRERRHRPRLLVELHDEVPIGDGARPERVGGRHPQDAELRVGFEARAVISRSRERRRKHDIGSDLPDLEGSGRRRDDAHDRERRPLLPAPQHQHRREREQRRAARADPRECSG